MTEIENPYAQAMVENFRRTPASLRPQLLKMLERELNGAESDQTVSAASFRRIPFDDRAEEFQWLDQNSARFQGEWVALRRKRLLAHNVDYSKVSQEVKSLGMDGAMFMFIEGEENEDFVRFLPILIHSNSNKNSSIKRTGVAFSFQSHWSVERKSPPAARNSIRERTFVISAMNTLKSSDYRSKKGQCSGLKRTCLSIR